MSLEASSRPSPSRQTTPSKTNPTPVARQDAAAALHASSGTFAPWLWPNLLSLDAPLIALLWQALFLYSYAAQESYPVAAAALLGLAVWLIYSADRMLDGWRDPGGQARHRFYQQHWRRIAPVWGIGLVAGLALALFMLPWALLWRGAVLTAAVGVYFLVVHALPGYLGRPGSKEAAVAVVFGLGTSLVIWPQAEGWIDLLPIALFAALCWINCTAIEDWEAGGGLRSSIVVTAALIALLAVVFLREIHSLPAIATVASTLAILALDRWFATGPSSGSHYSAEAKRVAADVALLTPAVVLALANI